MNRREVFKAGGIAAVAVLAGAGLPAIVAAAPAAGRAALPSDSVYHLATPLTDQNGRAFVLGEGRGTPTIVSMFYTSCQFVCPMLIETVRATQQKLSEAERRQVKVLMVSFDPEHDTVEVLRNTARDRQVDTANWALARTDAASVRRLAAVLGIQYKALANGDFNHTTALILLDAEGRIVGKTNKLGEVDPAFVRSVKTTVASAAH